MNRLSAGPRGDHNHLGTQLRGTQLRGSQLLGLVMGLALLAGCGSGTAHPASSTSPSRTSTAGHVVDQQDGCFRYLVPNGWPVVDHFVDGDLVLYANSPGTTARIASRCSAEQTPRTLDALADVLVRHDLRGRHPRRVADVELDGVPAYHLQGRAAGQAFDFIGVDHAGRRVALWFDLARDTMTGPTRARLVASVVRSWRWNP